MIDELKRSMKGQWDEAYPIRLVGVIHEKDDVVLSFDLLDYFEPEWVLQKWEITCANYIKCSHHFDFFDYEDINILSEHIFLWDINKDRYDLYFDSTPNNLVSFMGDLFLSHNELVKGTVPFGKYIENDYSK